MGVSVRLRGIMGIVFILIQYTMNKMIKVIDDVRHFVLTLEIYVL